MFGLDHSRNAKRKAFDIVVVNQVTSLQCTNYIQFIHSISRHIPWSFAIFPIRFAGHLNPYSIPPAF